MGNCMLKRSIPKSLDKHKHDDIYHTHHYQATPSSHSHDHHQILTIKVVTPNGGIMELYTPITADNITSEFPDHALFQSPDPTRSPPLLHNDQLHPGQLYYLLPLTNTATRTSCSSATPYRMSFDNPRVTLKGSGSDPDVVVPKYSGSGVWKVRLVINPVRLSEILSQDAPTEELIESVRTVAKCATAGATASSGGSGEWCRSSVSSFRDQRTMLHR